MQTWLWLANTLPPMDSMALDQATYDFMTTSMAGGCGYPWWLVRPGPNVIPIHG
jgi:hypothetical protein